MLRLKRKYLVLAVFVIFFILVYFYLNSNVPSNKNNNMVYIEEKLKQLENGFNKHRKQFGEIKKQIDTISNGNSPNSIADSPKLNSDLLIKDEVIMESGSHNDESCSLNMDVVPKPDIQMLKAYREIPFDNPDG
jgi:alpha-mannosidase II